MADITLTSLISSVTTFLADYGVLIAGGAVLALAGSMFGKMLRSGR